MRAYFVADVETTGVRPTDKIVEVCFIEIDEDLEEVNRAESLIDPEIEIPSGASAVHGITNDRVAEEPTIEQFMGMRDYPMMKEQPSVLIAHNAAFDMRYLGEWMHPESEVLCTLRLAKRLWPTLDSYKLQALRYSLGLPAPEGDAHRAGADVELLLNLVLYMLAVTELDLDGLLAMSKEPLSIKKMPFGKHKDKALHEVPRDYIEWLMKQDNVDSDLRASIEALPANR
jgi:DNA polymerase III epsilon subunit-like protein